MPSTIKIYKDCLITEKKNFYIESISDYLSNLTKSTFDDFKYIKHDKNISIKIDTETISEDLSSGELLDYFNSDNFNYVSIQNDDELSPVYYFIDKQSWKAQKTVIFDLTMDAINSFKLGVDYAFNKKTNVIREHKDRIYNSYYEDSDHVKHYRRKIDLLSEGLTPILYKKDERKITENNLDYDWYFLYKTDHDATSENPPIKGYIIPSEGFNATISRYGIDLSELGFNYFFFGLNLSQGNQSSRIIIQDGENEETIVATEYMYFSKVGQNHWIISKITNNKTNYQYVGYEWNREVVKSNIPLNAKILFETSSPIINIGTNILNVVRTTATETYNEIEQKIYNNQTSTLIPSSTIGQLAIDDIYSVDRTDATIYKIIKMPYAPISININNNIIQLPDYVERAGITWGTGQETTTKYYLKIKGDYYGRLIDNVENNEEIFKDLFTTFNETDLRNDDNESKLYHSAFNAKKFVYDNFSYVFKNETLSKLVLDEATPETKLQLNFLMTSTMNSRFLFDFANLVSDNKSTNDYDHILVVQRNNEIPIYNDSYLNYIRNGYNYDVKTKNRQLVGNVISTGLQAVGAIASVVAAPFTGGASLSGLAAISLGTSAIQTITSTINSTAQAEANIDQKLSQLENQSASVQGSDDVDLMSYYTGNRLKVCDYSVSENLKSHLADLFYYAGYITNEQKIPVVNTRKWFNYLQCEAVIENLKNIKPDILSVIVDKFKNGVTIFHKNSNSWDFSQVKSNNESWL